MRLTTLNKVEGYFMEKISATEFTPQQMKDFIAWIEVIDYDDEQYSNFEENLPREYRDEIVAWLREEYL